MSSSNKIAVYAGTFDPITNGHIDIVHRALKIFDTVYVAIAGSTRKNVYFSAEQRVELVKRAVEGYHDASRLHIEHFRGLLVDYVRSKGTNVIIRGLRAVSDYEYEAQMAHINRHLADDIETVFLVTSDGYSFISSSIVKEVARNKGDLSRMVPENVADALRNYVNGQK